VTIVKMESINLHNYLILCNLETEKQH